MNAVDAIVRFEKGTKLLNQKIHSVVDSYKTQPCQISDYFLTKEVSWSAPNTDLCQQHGFKLTRSNFQIWLSKRDHWSCLIHFYPWSCSPSTGHIRAISNAGKEVQHWSSSAHSQPTTVIPHLIVSRLLGESMKVKMLHLTPVSNAVTYSTRGGYHSLVSCRWYDVVIVSIHELGIIVLAKTYPSVIHHNIVPLTLKLRNKLARYYGKCLNAQTSAMNATPLFTLLKMIWFMWGRSIVLLTTLFQTYIIFTRHSFATLILPWMTCRGLTLQQHNYSP